MGSCIACRISQHKQHDDKLDINDHVIVDGRNAVCTGTDVISDQTFFRFQFRKEKTSRIHGETTELIPETNLKERVIKIAANTQDEWIGLRNKKTKSTRLPLKSTFLELTVDPEFITAHHLPSSAVRYNKTL